MASQNLLLWSEDFTNPIWEQVNSPVADAALSPIGSMTADFVTEPSPGAGANIVIQQSATPVLAGQTYTASIYARLVGTNDGDGKVTFVIGRTISGPFESGILNATLTSSWQRLIVTKTWAFDHGGMNVALQSTIGGARDIYVWGGQLNNGTTADPYIMTTSQQVIPNLRPRIWGRGLAFRSPF